MRALIKPRSMSVRTVPILALAGILTALLLPPVSAQTITNTATLEPPVRELLNQAFVVAGKRIRSSTGLVTPVLKNASVTVAIVTEADLVATKTVTPGVVPPGGTVVYRIEAQNLGPSSAQDVIVTDPLPAELRFVAVTAAGASCTTPPVGSTGTVECTFSGATLPGTVRVVEITAEVAGTVHGITLDNVATVSSATTDPVVANDTASAPLAVSSVLDVPTLSGLGGLVLGLVLASLGILAIRRPFGA